MFRLTHNDLIVSAFQISLNQPPVPVRVRSAQRPNSSIRVVQLSDLHFYENTDPEYYERVHHEVIQCVPDVVVMTGDLIHKGPRYITQASDFLTRLASCCPQAHCLAIMGNHDYQDDSDGKQLQAAVSASGFTVLVNEAVHLAGFLSPQSVGMSVNVVGLDDYYYGPRQSGLSRETGIQRAIESLNALPKSELTLGLMHNPLHMDVLHREFPSRCHWVLSGHTHAGHVWIPWLKPVYHHVFHHKYRYGWFPFGKSQLYVTSGVGSAAFYFKAFGWRAGLPRFRWNTNPEIAVFDLCLPE